MIMEVLGEGEADKTRCMHVMSRQNPLNKIFENFV